jgi:hypothetical protein
MQGGNKRRGKGREDISESKGFLVVMNMFIICGLKQKKGRKRVNHNHYHQLEKRQRRFS